MEFGNHDMEIETTKEQLYSAMGLVKWNSGCCGFGDFWPALWESVLARLRFAAKPRDFTQTLLPWHCCNLGRIIPSNFCRDSFSSLSNPQLTLPPPLLKMKYIFSEEQLVIPEDVKIHIRSRVVTVEGPRGTKSSGCIALPMRRHN